MLQRSIVLALEHARMQVMKLLLSVLLLSAVGFTQANQCYKDIECKGERICEQGVCVSPSAAQANQSANDAVAHSLPAATTTQAKVPQFKDYPVATIYRGRGAVLANANDDYRTVKTAALQENEVVFAGEYVIVTIGCGAGCRFQSLLSKKTGKELGDGFGGEGGELIKAVKTSSRLLVSAGKHPDNDNDPLYYAMFYVLENNRLNRIAMVPTVLPECEGAGEWCTIESDY